MAAIHEDVIRELKQFKFKNLMVTYIIYKINSEASPYVVTEKRSEPGSTFQSLLDDLPTNEPRFIFYDFGTRFIFISWIPDSSTVKNKMMYAATKGDIKHSFNMVTEVIDAANVSDITARMDLSCTYKK